MSQDGLLCWGGLNITPSSPYFSRTACKCCKKIDTHCLRRLRQNLGNLDSSFRITLSQKQMSEKRSYVYSGVIKLRLDLVYRVQRGCFLPTSYVPEETWNASQETVQLEGTQNSCSRRTCHTPLVLWIFVNIYWESTIYETLAILVQFHPSPTNQKKC